MKLLTCRRVFVFPPAVYRIAEEIAVAQTDPLSDYIVFPDSIGRF